MEEFSPAKFWLNSEGRLDIDKYHRCVESFVKGAEEYAKNHPRETYADQFDPQLVKHHDKYRGRLAHAALKHYNDTLGSDFELVKVLKVKFDDHERGTCYFLNFEAKHGNDCPHLFFAEVLQFFEDLTVLSCSIEDSGSSGDCS